MCNGGKIIGRDRPQAKAKTVAPVAYPARQIKALKQRADCAVRGIGPSHITAAGRKALPHIHLIGRMIARKADSGEGLQPVSTMNACVGE